MTHRSKQIIRDAMARDKDDNLERAESMFRNCTPEEMQQRYGQSDRTRQEILDGHASHRRQWQEANDELEALLKEV